MELISSPESRNRLTGIEVKAANTIAQEHLKGVGTFFLESCPAMI
jgi:hypothetical protein